MALTNSQYDKIMRDYEKKQLNSREQLQLRHDEVYKKLPEMHDIDTSIATLSMERARALLMSDDSSAIPSLKDELHHLIDRRNRLLSSNGFELDYLEPNYECPDCKDTGYIGSQKCHCFKKLIIELLYLQSNLKEMLKKENFSTFNLSLYSSRCIDSMTGRSSLETMQNMLDTCHNFVDTFGVEHNNLFLYGDTGVGKTFLSHCIAKELIDHSFSVIYFSAFTLFDTLAKSKFNKDLDAKSINEYIFDCDLLIVDDLGTELTNSFITSEFFHCINERLFRNKSTIISTNLSLESLRDLYSERTFSRITSKYTMLKLTGEDIRLKKKLLNMED
ncbi:MAG: ATP-binding protein [Eubacteriales bacterium]